MILEARHASAAVPARLCLPSFPVLTTWIHCCRPSAWNSLEMLRHRNTACCARATLQLQPCCCPSLLTSSQASAKVADNERCFGQVTGSAHIQGITTPSAGPRLQSFTSRQEIKQTEGCPSGSVPLKHEHQNESMLLTSATSQTLTSPGQRND